MVHGDKRPHLVAILVPDQEFLAAFAREHGKDPDLAAPLAAWADDPDLRAALSKAVERVNQARSPHERVRRFTLAREPFTVENQMMTPTLKIRRHRVQAAYGEKIEGLY